MGAASHNASLFSADSEISVLAEARDKAGRVVTCLHPGEGKVAEKHA